MALSKVSAPTLEKLKHHFLEWCCQKEKKKFTLLITGKTGVGKSSLVNALIGKPEAEEGDDKFSHTKEVTSYDVDIEGLKICVWDSPGLRDDDDDEDGTCNDEKYLADMERKITEEVDLVIFCLKMDDQRFQVDDKQAFKMVTKHFGKKVWKNAVIALTCANKVGHPARDDGKMFFLQQLANWREAIHLFLDKKLKLDPKLVQSLPIVPTGYYQPFTALPNGENWLSEFWIACYNVARSSTAITLYRINRNRLRFPGSGRLATACSGSEVAPTSPGAVGSEIPMIDLNEEQQETFWKTTWRAFMEYCSRVHVVLGNIGSASIEFIKSIIQKSTE